MFYSLAHKISEYYYYSVIYGIHVLITPLFYILSGFVEQKNIKDYHQYREQYSTASNEADFQRAVEHIEDFINNKQVKTHRIIFDQFFQLILLVLICICV